MKHPWDPQTFSERARAEGRCEDTIRACVNAGNFVKRTHPDLPVIFTLSHLAHLTDVNVDFIQEIAHRKVDPYRVFRVKKRGSPNSVAKPPRRYRTICVPDPRLMRLQRWIAQNILQTTPVHSASFAFIRHRDLVGAAKKHLNAKWMVKMDLRHFFESIPESAVYRVFLSFGYCALLAFQMARVCTRLPRHHSRDRRASLGRGGRGPYRTQSMGHLPQGAPSSPMLANRAVETLDAKLEQFAKDAGWVYTRYADDLAFSRSTNTTREEALHLARKVEGAICTEGLEVHRAKTSIIPPGGRKVLLGLLVDRGKPRLTKSFRNNIETHLYALKHPLIGAERHRLARGFTSTIGMRRHIMGLIAFAHQVDEVYAAKLYEMFNKVDWST